MIVAIAIAAVIGVAIAVYLVSDHNDDGTFAVTYYKDGRKVLETRVPPGTSLMVYGDMGESKSLGRFVGWNTKTDMTGTMMMPGSQIKVDRNISLFAAMAGNGLFMIVLPGEQKGYTLTADPLYAVMGGSSIVTYTLLPSHMEESMVISVNGNPMKLDAMKRIHISNITEDQFVTVTGVFDKREHSISLPEEQRGYTLASSAEKVHHGESYTLEFTMLEGYRKTDDFGIRLNGGDARVPTDGILLIEDVMDNHLITVTGVVPDEYSVILGKNISALVNGAPSSKVTVEDVLTILPNEGYFIPESFNTQIIGKFTSDWDGYHVSSNIAFPSVLRITAGDNVKMNGWSSNMAFVCPGDVIGISPASGHQFPDDYTNTIKKLKGVRYSAEGFSFSDDAELPSIYSVIFNDYNKIHATFYVVGGVICPLPKNNPERIGYYFEKWDTVPTKPVDSDLLIISIWDPMTHEVYFGPNLIVQVGNKNYSFVEGTDEPPRIIKINSDEKVIINTAPFLGLTLPINYGPSQTNKVVYRDGYYEILGDASFPGITTVEYMDSGLNSRQIYLASIGRAYTILPAPAENMEGYKFLGWMFDGEYVNSQITIIENKPYTIYAKWAPIDS